MEAEHCVLTIEAWASFLRSMREAKNGLDFFVQVYFTGGREGKATQAFPTFQIEFLSLAALAL